MKTTEEAHRLLEEMLTERGYVDANDEARRQFAAARDTTRRYERAVTPAPATLRARSTGIESCSSC